MNFKTKIIFIITFLFLIPYAFAGTISSCNPTLVSGTPGNPNIYTITQNIQSPGNCFTITNLHDIIIQGQVDGNNNLITHVTSAGTALSISGTANHITFKNVIVDNGGFSVVYGLNTPAYVTIDRVKFLNGGAWIYGSEYVSIINSEFYGANSVYIYGSESQLNNRVKDIIIRNNKLLLSGGQGDTYDIFRLKDVQTSIVDGNYIEDANPNQILAVKIFQTNLTNFTNNIIKTNTGPFTGSVYAAIRLRSSTSDNYFYNNTFIALRGGAEAVGVDIDASNMCCDANGNLGSPCSSPPVGFTNPCFDRRNVFDSNTIISDGKGFNIADMGVNNIFKNNLVIGNDAGIHAGCSCEGSEYYYNNVFVSDSGNAFEDDSSWCSGTCRFESRNNIFYSRTGQSVSKPGSVSFTGDYNLFYPAYSSGQAHSISGQDPQFINPTANPIFDSNYNLLRDYHLLLGSPAINTGSPTINPTLYTLPDGTPQTLYRLPNGQAYDRDTIKGIFNLRPNEVIQDMGAYEFEAGLQTICSDTDSGINYNVQGTVAIAGNPVTYTDYCNADSITLNEYYCLTPQDNSPSISTTPCQYGCSNGRCNPDTVAPAISNIQSGSITGNSAIITWTTDEQSTSVVNYGTSPGNYPNQATTPGMVTSHSVQLSNLNPATTYYYKVSSTDASGNTRESINDNVQKFSTISSVSCGAACNGCINNRILADSCARPIPPRQCDGTNSVEDIIISPGTIISGQQVTATISYSCYGSTDNLALWYYDGMSWKLLRYWAPGTLTGCDVIEDGSDGTVSFTFTPNTNPGTHYARAIEADGTVYSNANSCPNIQWGNIDDLAFNVQMPSGAGTPDLEPILIKPRRRSQELFNYIGLLIALIALLMLIGLIFYRKPKKKKRRI